MNRNTPLRRSSPLAARTPLQRSAGLVRRPVEDEPCKRMARLLETASGQRRRKPIRPVSRKRAKENLERRRLVREIYGDERPQCARPGCPRLADDIHEILPRARGGSIVDPLIWAPLCRPCHDEATNEAEWAYRAGLLVHSWDEAGTGLVRGWPTLDGRWVFETAAPARRP